MRIETTAKNLTDAITAEWLPEETFHRFIELQGQLEPERLHMDGEATPAQVRSQENRVRKEWKALEESIGRKVSDSDIWNIYWQKRRHGDES